MPVDIAGFMKNKKTVAVFIEEHELRMEEMYYNFTYTVDENGILAPNRRKLSRKLLEDTVKEDERALNQVKKVDQETPFDTIKSDGVNDIGQKVVRVDRKSRKELKNEYEKALIRVFYWAAFYGYNETVIDYMILYKRWAPFIKSFKL